MRALSGGKVMSKGIVQIILSCICLLAVIYGLMWLLSSSHLAHDYCKGQFDLFHEQFRCRQPQLAIILLGASSLIGSILLFLGIRNIKVHRAIT
jgi:hypothetical protein